MPEGLRPPGQAIGKKIPSEFGIWIPMVHEVIAKDGQQFRGNWAVGGAEVVPVEVWWSAMNGLLGRVRGPRGVPEVCLDSLEDVEIQGHRGFL